MNEKIYLHTINNGCRSIYTSKKQLEVFKQILESGELRSLRLQGKEMHPTFSGLDYISLSDYEKRDICNKEQAGYNTFNGYARDGISFAFPHENLDVIEPELMTKLGLSEEGRYSDLPDEVQVKDRVSLDKMSGITFPVESYLDTVFFRRKKVKLELIKQEINIIKELLDKYNYNDINLYNIDDLQEINDDYLEERIMLTKTK